MIAMHYDNSDSILKVQPQWFEGSKLVLNRNR